MAQSSSIARFLNKELHGNDIKIHKPVPLNGIAASTVTFAKKASDEIIGKINAQPEALVIAHISFAGLLTGSYILSDNPRLDFAYVMQEFFAAKVKPGIAATAIIGENTLLGQNVAIGEYTVIDDGVVVGDNTVIGSHVRIKGKVSIGGNCIIKSHAVIGEPGFGFERNEAGVPIRLPHIGGVKIGKNVEIGSFNTINSGTLEPTIIEDNTKLDDHVHIAHNCTIGESCLITGCAAVSGSVKVGGMSWIGPNAAIIENINIGKNTFIGIGSVINKPVEDDKVVSGNPARVIGSVKHLLAFRGQLDTLKNTPLENI